MNTPHNSLNAIVLLFTKSSANVSEKYVYSNIESVNATIEGVSNALYSGESGSLTRNTIYKHARAFFLNSVKDVVKPTKYFGGNKFALVVDLRYVNDKDKIGTGRKFINTQDGVYLKIKKKATTNDVTCHVFTVCDCIVRIDSRDYEDMSK